MISSFALQEFKTIWKEEFGSDIPEELAIEEAINLLNIIDKIYRPIKQEWVNEYEETKLE
jgi:hypothetical protein